MTDDERGTNGPNGNGRLAAHERLSTGALAGWTRACATHRGASSSAGSASSSLLIVLVATVGGEPAGRVRDPGLGHAEGDRPDRGGVRVRAGRRAERRLRGAARASGSTRRSARPRSRRRSRACSRPSSRPAEDKAGLESVGDPFSERHLLRGRPHRLRRGAVRPDDRGHGPRRGRRCAGCRPRDGRAGGRDGGVQRRGRVPADRAGDVGGCSACSPRSSCCSSSSARSWRC